MSQFIDALSRKWTIDINVLSIKKLRAELDVDLLSLADKPVKGQPGLLQRLASDPILLVDTISVLLSDEIRKRNIDELGFAEGMIGIGLSNACEALIETIVNFIPPPKGPMIRTMYDKLKLIESAGCLKLTTAMDSPAMEQKLNHELDQALATLISTT